MNRKLITFAAFTLATLGIAVAGGTPASAHTPKATANCDGVTLNLTNYEGPRYGDSVNNDATVYLDGTIYSTIPFATELKVTIPWQTQAVSHTWKVDVNANFIKGDPHKYDFTASGTVDGCPPPETTTTTGPPAETTTTTQAPATTTPHTTTTPATSVPQPSVPVITNCTGICGPATVPDATMIPRPEGCILRDGTVIPAGQWVVNNGDGFVGSTWDHAVPCKPAVAAATAPTPPAAAGQLPATGGSNGYLLTLGAIAGLAGIALTFAARRNRNI